jgi:hypothetical protein
VRIGVSTSANVPTGPRREFAEGQLGHTCTLRRRPLTWRSLTCARTLLGYGND